MIIPLAGQTYSRYGVAADVLQNLYVEGQPAETGRPAARRPRPGLSELEEIGMGPIRAVVKDHKGSRYVVAGTRVYKDGVQIGIIPGLSLVRWDKSADQLVMVAPDTDIRTAYVVGDDVTAIAMPDDNPVFDVGFAAGRFIYLVDVADNPGQFRYSEVGDAADIGGLNFATAEAQPDALTAIAVLPGDYVLFFGATTTEWWGATTSTALPFSRIGGRQYNVGAAAQSSVVEFDNGLMWIGSAQSEGQAEGRTDLGVYETGAVAQKVSTHGIDAMLAQCEDIESCTAFAAYAEGHAWYVLNIPGVGTVAYDAAGPNGAQWAEWSSLGRETFRVQCADGGVYGDAVTGLLWTLDPDRYTDGDDVIQYVVSAYLSATSKGRMSVLELLCAKGVGGPGDAPVIECRYSDRDNGSWSTWAPAAVGGQGENPRVVWRSQGLWGPPGRAYQFRCAEGVAFIPFGLMVNEPR